MRQGALGDCYLVAAVCALSHRYPDTLNEIVVREGGVVSVRVPGDTIELMDTLPQTGEGTDFYGSSGDIAGPMLEKAWASKHGGYGEIEGGLAADVMEWIVGRVANVEVPASMSIHALEEVLRSRAVVASCAYPQKVGPSRLVGPHAYIVESYDGMNVTLRNPWGCAHPEPIPVADFMRIFWRISWI